MPQDNINTNRVFKHTQPKVNDRILTNIRKSVLYYQKNPDQIENRLNELNEEWDVEQLLETNASIIALLGVLGAVIGKKSWLLLPIVVLSFLLQHALQGWCPPIVLFRRLGVRTTEEITRERNLLKAVRGDFDSIAQLKSGDDRTQQDILFEIFT